MLKYGDQIFLGLTKEGIYFSSGDCLPADCIRINLATPRYYELRMEPFRVLARVDGFEDGVLRCHIIHFNPKDDYLFDRQFFDISGVRQLVLSGGNTGAMLNMSHLGRGALLKGVPALAPQSSVPVPADDFSHEYPGDDPVAETPVPQFEPEEFEEPEAVYVREFEFPFYEMRIAEGAAFFKSWFPIPGTLKAVELELRVENSFLCPEFDSIKQYLKNFLKVKSVKVTATICCRGSEVLSVDAVSAEVAAITSHLLDTVKYWYIKRELRAAEEKSGLVTVDDLFEKVRGSGLQPADSQFVDDLLTVKRLKHAEHMQYLSGLHLYDLMKLRMQKKPFAFVCFVAGKQDCFFVLETLDKADATYFWKLNATEEQVRQNRQLIPEAFIQVEQDISLIRDHGRHPYRKDAPENFTFVEHDYKSKDGLAEWKAALHQVLDGYGA